MCKSEGIRDWHGENSLGYIQYIIMPWFPVGVCDEETTEFREIYSAWWPLNREATHNCLQTITINGYSL